MSTSRSPLFITCSPFIEPFLVDELQEMGIEHLRLGYRGVYVDEWDWSTIYRINYGSRLASRVLLPLARFGCFDKHSLYRNASKIEWHRLINERQTFAIDANVQHPELRNSLFAAQIVKDAICDQIRDLKGDRPSVDLENPDVQINLFIHEKTAIISFDTSGAPLHKRGYRQESVEAPLQEGLAAAMLRIARYSSDSIYLDPCCGSGTFLIEAALMATRTPPGYLRQQWGFMRNPAFDQLEWLKVRNELDSHRIPLQPNHLFGIDRSQQAVRAAKINLKAAGFHQSVTIEQCDFREYEPKIAPNFILTNPPHGRRLEEEALLHPLYRALGQFIKNKCTRPARAFIFTGSLELAKEVGLAANKRHVLNSGGIDSRLLEYEIYS